MIIKNRKGLIISLLVVFIISIAGCGGGNSGRNSTNDQKGAKSYTIGWQTAEEAKSLKTMSTNQNTEEPTPGSGIPAEQTSDGNYFVHDPVVGGMIGTNSLLRASLYAYELDPASLSHIPVKANWSIEDSAVGSVNPVNDAEETQFIPAGLGVTNVVAEIKGIKVKIKTSVYPGVILKGNTNGFVFENDKAIDDPDHTADISIDPISGKVFIPKGICSIDNTLAKITEAPTDSDSYIFKPFWTIDELFHLGKLPIYILRTSKGQYVKLYFLSHSNGSSYDLTFIYFKATGVTNFFQY